ncbi:MAG: NADH-quinone oxidoreductase subunit C [Endomicrobiaceae bacterium]
MKTANEIAEIFKNKYSSYILSISAQRERRLWVEVNPETFREVFEKITSDEGFSIMSTISGLDLKDKFQVIYHMSNEDGVVISIKVDADRENPVVPTITDLFPAAELSERELEDLLGIKVSGLVQGRRYPLPDKWPDGQYPLRKDWDKSVLNNKTEDGGKNE